MAAPAVAAPPNNDNMGAAFSIPVNTTWGQNTSEATFETGEPDFCGSRDLVHTVWYRFKGTGGPVLLETSSSNFDTVVILYRDSPADANEVACDDDSGTGYRSRLSHNTIAGRDYFVQIGGCNACDDGSGTGTDTPDSGQLFLTALANDDRAWPEVLSSGTPVTRTDAFATTAAGEPTSCNGVGYDRTVWFAYDAPGPGTAVFTVTGYAAVATVFRGTESGAMACSSGGVVGTKGARVEVPVGAGRFMLQVGTQASETGQNEPNVTVEFRPDHDLDDDGVNGSPGDDCDDGNPGIRPGLAEAINNEVDENCDRFREYDVDRDNARVYKNQAGALEPRPGSDCDDNDPARSPTNTEVVGNAKDENCDGVAAPYPRIRSSVKHDYNVYSGGYMKFTELRITGLVAGSRVEVRCSRRAGGRRGPGCPFKRRVATRRSKSSRLNLLSRRLLGGKKIGRNLNVDVSITKAGMVGRRKRIWLPLRGTKAKSQYTCLGATTGRPTRCR